MNECAVLHEAAQAAHDTADYDALEKFAKDLIIKAATASDICEEAWGHTFLGNARIHREDAPSAERAYNRALELFTRLDDRAGIARCYMNLGTLAIELHLDVAEARRFYDLSVPMVRSTGDRHRLGVALGNLGEICRQEGDYAQAMRLANESLELFRETGDVTRAGWQLFNIAHIQSLRREYPAAIDTLRESFVELRKTGNARWLAMYFDVWIILAVELSYDEIAARLLGFVEQFRYERNVRQLRGMIPWFLPHLERLSKHLSEDRLAVLRAEGASMTIEQADALTQTF